MSLEINTINRILTINWYSEPFAYRISNQSEKLRLTIKVNKDREEKKKLIIIKLYFIS